ncbi:hypothetical protein [Embleya sp. AB8]
MPDTDPARPAAALVRVDLDPPPAERLARGPGQETKPKVRQIGDW